MGWVRDSNPGRAFHRPAPHPRRILEDLQESHKAYWSQAWVSGITRLRAKGAKASHARRTQRALQRFLCSTRITVHGDVLLEVHGHAPRPENTRRTKMYQCVCVIDEGIGYACEKNTGSKRNECIAFPCISTQLSGTIFHRVCDFVVQFWIENR